MQGAGQGELNISGFYGKQQKLKNCRNCIVFEYSAYLSAARQLSGLTHAHTPTQSHTHPHTPAHISINYFYDSHKAHKTLSCASTLVMTAANIWFNCDRRSSIVFPAYFLPGNSCQQLPIALNIRTPTDIYIYGPYSVGSQGPKVRFLCCIFTYLTFNELRPSNVLTNNILITMYSRTGSIS